VQHNGKTKHTQKKVVGILCLWYDPFQSHKNIYFCFITNFQNSKLSHQYILKVNPYTSFFNNNCRFVNFDFLDLGLFKTSHVWTKIKLHFYCIHCPLNYVDCFSVQQRTIFCFAKAHQVSVLILAVF
jgi:hypothetical protein